MTCDPRWATPRARRRTLGPQVTAAAKRIGLDLLPWQRQVVDAAPEQSHGRPAYRDVIISVPRQSGKRLGTTVIYEPLVASAGGILPSGVNG